MRSTLLTLAALVLASAPGRAQVISPDPDASDSLFRAQMVVGKVMGSKCVGGPPGSKCGPNKPTIVITSVPRGQFEIVVHQGFAYVHMNSTVASAFTTLVGPGAPSVVGKLNGVAVSPSANRIKMAYDVIVTVTETGANAEQNLTAADIEAIEALGAKKDPATGHFAAREYLRFHLTAPVDHLDVEVPAPKHIIFKLHTLLYF